MHLCYKVLSNSSKYLTFTSLKGLVLVGLRGKVKCLLDVMVSLMLTVLMLGALCNPATRSRISLAELGKARVQFSEGSVAHPSAN